MYQRDSVSAYTVNIDLKSGIPRTTVATGTGSSVYSLREASAAAAKQVYARILRREVEKLLPLRGYSSAIGNAGPLNDNWENLLKLYLELTGNLRGVYTVLPSSDASVRVVLNVGKCYECEGSGETALRARCHAAWIMLMRLCREPENELKGNASRRSKNERLEVFATIFEKSDLDRWEKERVVALESLPNRDLRAPWLCSIL